MIGNYKFLTRQPIAFLVVAQSVIEFLEYAVSVNTIAHISLDLFSPSLHNPNHRKENKIKLVKILLMSDFILPYSLILAPLMLYFYVAIDFIFVALCANMPPEKMLPFAAQVVSLTRFCYGKQLNETQFSIWDMLW